MEGGAGADDEFQELPGAFEFGYFRSFQSFLAAWTTPHPTLLQNILSPKELSSEMASLSQRKLLQHTSLWVGCSPSIFFFFLKIYLLLYVSTL
jgi:hypothetical protein